MIDAATAVLSHLETRRYHLGQARHELVRMARELIGPYFANVPNGVMCLSKEFLVHDEATYLVVGLTDAASYVRDRLILTRIGFKTVDGVRQACNLDTGELLGEMNRLAVTARRSWRNDDWYSPNLLREAAYTGLVFGSPDRNETLNRYTYVLPLTGPALMHPAFQRLASLASAILSGRVSEIRKLRAVDAELDEVDAGKAEQEAIIAAVIEEAVAEYQPREWDPELVRLMETMDWTFDYADWPNSAFYDQRRQIERRLHALPLEVAIAFLHVAGHSWRYAYHLLRNHPETVKAAA
jgi:hypothetical protein